MDAAGKDSTIKHVMSGVNPQGCQVYSFKAPYDRGARPRLPVAVRAGAARARPDRHLQPLATTRRCSSCACTRSCSSTQKLPARLVDASRSGRSASTTSAISSATSTRNGTLVRKFFLHVSRRSRSKRFLERLDQPEKNWKFSAADAARARALERLHGGLRGHDPATPRRRTRPGTSFPPTTSGSRASSSPRPSSTRWRDWISSIPRSRRASARRSPAPKRPWATAIKKTRRRTTTTDVSTTMKK